MWVKENNIFYQGDVSDPNTMKQLTTNGRKNAIYNGVPDWVYEGGEIVLINGL